MDTKEIVKAERDATKRFWEAHRKGRPQTEIDRIEAEVSRYSAMLRSALAEVDE